MAFGNQGKTATDSTSVKMPPSSSHVQALSGLLMGLFWPVASIA
jgi:hypothetical protein